jgi:hypothetical protein
MQTSTLNKITKVIRNGRVIPERLIIRYIQDETQKGKTLTQALTTLKRLGMLMKTNRNARYSFFILNEIIEGNNKLGATDAEIDELVKAVKGNGHYKNKCLKPNYLHVGA